jgi:hypothetical protein
MYFNIDVQEIRKTNRIHKLNVKCFTTIREIKYQLQPFISLPLNRMQVFHASRSEALSNHTTLHELGIDREGFVLMLSVALTATPQYLLEPLKGCFLDSKCKELVQQVRQGLNGGQVPSKTDLLDCTGGVYFLKSHNGSSTGVFKPHDEEQGMPNNPKGHAGNGKVGLRQYFLPGEGYIREVAAYILDYKNFAGVPATCIVHCEHPSFHYPDQRTNKVYPKLGSLQQFIKASDTFEDISPSLIGTLELQKIALLDMRILNCDRNSANILANRKSISQMQYVRHRRDSRSGSMTSVDDDYEEMDMNDFMDRPLKKNSSRNDDLYQLIPIDHGYCLPPKLLIEEFDWAWFYCPQISQPVDPEIKAYMNEINIEELIEKLRKQVSLPEDSLFLIRLAHNLILEGINQGLTLRDIAGMIARTDDGVPSVLEKAVQAAEENAQRTVEAHRGFLGAALVSPPRRGKSPSSVNTIVHNVLSPKQVPEPTLSPLIISPMSQKVNTKLSCPETCPSGSYLRPKGPLAYLNTLEPGILSPPASRPDTRRSMDSCFDRNFSPEHEFTESSSDSSNDTFQMRKDAFSSSNDNGNNFEPVSVNDMGMDLDDERCDPPAVEGNPVRRVSSFSLLEVQTTEPMRFEKASKSALSGTSTKEKDRHSSGCTSEEELEMESTFSSSPSEMMMYDLPKFPPQQSLGLTRVVSFNAFESPALYEVDRSDRHFNRLKREKRKLSAKSPEFQELRMNFAKEAIIKTISTQFKSTK